MGWLYGRLRGVLDSSGGGLEDGRDGRWSQFDALRMYPPLRRSEAGHHFYFADLEAANAAVRTVHGAGATVVELTPVKESLEDFFMREQEGAS